MMTMLQFDTRLESTTRPAPVDDLLAVYLGQTSGGRVPAPACAQPVADGQDLWDYLGDFA